MRSTEATVHPLKTAATPSSPLVLRPATARDFPALVALSRSSGVFTEVELDCLAEDLTGCDPAAGDALAVAADGEGRPLGFIQYSPAIITEGTWYVYWIAVAKQTHGQGVGGALLAQAEEAIRALGGRQVLIETSSKSIYDATRRFYLGRGYRIAAQLPDYYAIGDDKCIFLKRL